jgi:ribosomal protein RSM22 (predicted rRNA methylase)
MTGLPDDLRAALDDVVAEGAPVPMGCAAARLSAAYRDRRPSRAAVVGAEDVSAYLLTRLPATYAASARVLAEAADIADFAPRSLLDAGAGPGTASWAAAAQFPGLAEIVWLDDNRRLLETAAQLGRRATHPALAGARALAGSLAAPPLGDSRFDMVTAAYALTELGDAEIVPAALALWVRCDGVFVIVEPGRPRDYARLMAVRAALLGAGARMVAPCPHEHACPLPEGDWCHFAVRLPRSRAHRHAKRASLGHEDEKFSYLVVARPDVTLRLPVARVIKPPILRKFEVELPLCATDGLEDRRVPSRDAAAFKAAKKLRWGASVE